MPLNLWDGDEMTEFTSEVIAFWRNTLKVVAGVRGGMMEIEKFALEALDHIEHLQKRIEELEQERRWTSVDERLPNSSERVLIRMSNYYTVIASYFRNQKCWKNDAGATVHNVTHWQPLPQPPKEEE